MYCSPIFSLTEDWIGPHIQQIGHQPGTVANPARGQLNRENELFPVHVRARESGLAREVRPRDVNTTKSNVTTIGEGLDAFRFFFGRRNL